MKIMAISLIFITQKLKHEMLRGAHGSIADLKKKGNIFDYCEGWSSMKESLHKLGF